ncbi:hypothetical protein OG689_41970 [Kitasatospora sp. NBC_00240]|uniref:hypothetical protein n=1 Tax=Kitasatospora sp. NBC_00240 TaxID=2903567 RepID=UPI0022531942|nr:hypothetical protein [Kitasatospora sp. NBC_00240]MCX5215726.1 hypothetical protein [Kitasatospora sp. NBC_00240]
MSTARVGERWWAAEFAQLVTELREGLVLEDLAQIHGRSPNAVRAAMLRLLPHQDGLRRADAEALLRARLADDEQYDWESVLRANLARHGQTFWSTSDDQVLTTAWERRDELPDLAGRLGVSELAVVWRLRELGLAERIGEVTERLGCAPGGDVELRAKIAADSAECTVHVLIAELPSGQWHVSVHGGVPEAEDALEDLREASPSGQGLGRWQISSRLPGASGGRDRCGPGASDGQ